MPQHALSCLLLLLLLNPGLLLSAADTRPLIDLGSANIRGVQVTDDVEFYGGEFSSCRPTTLISLIQPSSPGVPFAEPPLGEARLRPPVLKASLPDGEHDARTSGPACLQSRSTRRLRLIEPIVLIYWRIHPQPAHIDGTSEDCSTLDVYRLAGCLNPCV